MLTQTDEVLTEFEADVAGLVSHRREPAADTDAFDVIERAVKALNAVNARFGEAAYETGEGEQLCAYIEAVLDEIRNRCGRVCRPSWDDPPRDHRRVAGVVSSTPSGGHAGRSGA